MPARPRPLDREAQGDFSGLKGSEYHLLYAAWLILVQNAREVVFYAGNDLLAHAIVPKATLEREAAAGLRVLEPDVDRWIQLKAEARPVTTAAVLKDNLLSNFLFNALLSESRNRRWSVCLVTTAEVRRSQLRSLLAPASLRGSQSKQLQQIARNARERWIAHLGSEDRLVEAPTPQQVWALLTSILKALADESIQLPLEALRSQLELELLDRLGDRTSARRALASMPGAVVRGLSADFRPRALRLASLEEASGWELTRHALERDPVDACEAQIQRVHPTGWATSLAVERHLPTESLRRFLASDRTLFVLVGESGTGKSWLSASWAAVDLCGRTRVRIPNPDLGSSSSLRLLLGRAFESLRRPGSTDDHVLARLSGAATAPERGPLVVLLDLAPVRDAPTVTSSLEALCAEARRERVRLVVTIGPAAWRRVSSQILLEHLFVESTVAIADGSWSSNGRDADLEAPHTSHRLSLFTRGELTAALEMRVPPASFPLALRRVNSPDLSQLARHPSLLSLLLSRSDTHQPDWREGPIDVDHWIDDALSARYHTVRANAGCAGELPTLLDRLPALIWSNRQQGLDLTSFLGHLKPHIERTVGRKLLDGLVDAEILTLASTSGTINVNLAPTLFGDRLQARWLERRLEEGEDVLGDMMPGVDDGAMLALTRAIARRDPDAALQLSERALDRSSDWLTPMAEGLAQGSADHWRVLASITSWTNRPGGYSTWNAMRALGGMASRSARARLWLAALYSGPDQTHERRGQLALTKALETVPAWVWRRVRLRVAAELASRAQWSSDDHDKARRIANALEPLTHIGDKAAASVGRSLLRWIGKVCAPLLELERSRGETRLDSTIAAVRGSVAAFGNADEIGDILSDLDASDERVRLAAASALVPLSRTAPIQVRGVLMRALEQEHTAPVVLELLRCLHSYIINYPQDAVRALRSCGVTTTVGLTGSALSVLSELAKYHPSVASALVVEATLSVGERVLVDRELLALTWVHCAKLVTHRIEAERALDALIAVPDEPIEANARMLTFRGLAVASLARLVLTQPNALAALRTSSVNYLPSAMQHGIDVLFVDADRAFDAFSVAECSQNELANLCFLLYACLVEHISHEPHPIERIPHAMQRYAAVQVAHWLGCLLAKLPEFHGVLVSLPSEHALRVAIRLVETGTISRELVDHCRAICVRHSGELSNLSAARDAFLAAGVQKGLLPADALGFGRTGFEAQSDARKCDGIVEARSEQLFSVLHSAVTADNAVPFLWSWACGSRSWRAVLLGQVHRLVFSERELALHDCVALCAMVAEACRDLPEDEYAQRAAKLFAYLATLIDGAVPTPPDLAFPADLLSESMALALRIVSACRAVAGDTQSVVFSHLSKGQGVVDDRRHWISLGSVTSGSSAGRGVTYLPPAVRVACALVGHQGGVGDLGSRWMQQRAEIRAVMDPAVRFGEKLERAIAAGTVNESDRNTLGASLLTVANLQARFPQHPDPLEKKGFLLLVLGELPEAEAALKECLELGPPPRDRASALYNLGCVLARQGKDTESEKCLRLSLDCGQLMTDDGLYADPDLLSVRHKPWFVRLLADIQRLRTNAST